MSTFILVASDQIETLVKINIGHKIKDCFCSIADWKWRKKRITLHIQDTIGWHKH